MCALGVFNVLRVCTIYQLGKTMIVRGFLLCFLCSGLWAPLQAQDFSACGEQGQAACDIDSWADLHAIRSELAKSYRLTTDLSSETDGYNTYASEAANEGKGWLPIGEGESEFIGSFDGNGHRISDLSIRAELSEDGFEAIGLFGFVGRPGIFGDGIINNVILEDIDYQVSCPTDPFGFFRADLNLGGLMGFKQQSVEARHMMISGAISLDYAACSVTLRGYTVGGVIGFNRGILDQAYANLTISVSDSTDDSFGGAQVGGIVGFNQGELTEVAFHGEINGPTSGGIAGFNDATIFDSYAVGTVAGQSKAAGIAAQNQGNFARSYFSGSVTLSEEGDLAALVSDSTSSDIGEASYWDQDVLGEVTDEFGSGLSGSQMRTAMSFAGWDFTETGPWTIEEGAYRSYPYLRAFDYDAPDTIEPVRAIPGLQAICSLGTTSETGYAPCTPCPMGTTTNQPGADTCRVEKIPTLNPSMLALLAGLLAMLGVVGIRRSSL